MARSFSASVSAWTRKSKARMTAVHRTAAQIVAREVRVPVAHGGNMPVVTGHLRRSLLASTAAMPRIDPNFSEGAADNDMQISMVLAGAEVTDTIYLGFTAAYARPMERKYAFTRTVAQRWKQIAAEAVRTVKAQSGGA